ncbi:hypothetical protein OIU76_003008 [Salix suchowensis]|nr:hypothetical protein OIU76_003008 [Salix suchowensis]
MGHFSAIFSCFVPSASSRVTDEAHDKAEIPKSKSKSSALLKRSCCFKPGNEHLEVKSHMDLLTSSEQPPATPTFFSD